MTTARHGGNFPDEPGAPTLKPDGVTPPVGGPPVGGIEETGTQKILLFPEKLAALMKIQRGGPDLSYPISVELSLTNECNQNCLWCSDKALRGRCPDALGLADFENLFDDLAQGGARGVTIEGGGEPTISPIFEETARAALARGLAVGLISNGLELFNKTRGPEFYENFEWVRLSLDAASPEQYRLLKGHDGFERVLGNLARLKNANSGLTVGVGYVLTNANDQPELLRGLALRLGAAGMDYLQVRPVVDHPELVSEADLGFLKELERPGFSVNLSALGDNQPSGNLGLPCLAHSLSVVIGADGAVWLCGRLNTAADARPIGRLARESFSRIWHGAERRRQAEELLSGGFCRAHCPQCRITKYNRLLDELARVRTRNFI